MMMTPYIRVLLLCCASYVVVDGQQHPAFCEFTCVHNAYCTLTWEGTHECHCKPGLQGDGETCAKWTYDRNAEIGGPADWTNGACEGVQNSLINIAPAEVTGVFVKEAWSVSTVGWNNPSAYTVTNNGHSIMFTPESQITTAGGHLGSTYKLAQFHFHWGATNLAGSEHQINERSYPLEMHIVHYKNRYPNTKAALANVNDHTALAVFGFFFELSPVDNPVLAYLMSGVWRGRAAAASVSGVWLNALSQMTGESVHGDYYRYLGGLTTPNCNQQVLWTMFATPIKISQAQLNIFRNVKTHHGQTELYRPIQSLNGRALLKYTSSANYLPAILAAGEFELP